MSHTQCDARQQSRFELWSSEQWGHRGAGGINLLAYNAAFLINGGSGSTVWKMPHCLIAWLSVAKRIMCCLTLETETMDRKEWIQHSHIAFWPLFPLNQTDSSVLFPSCRIVHDQHLLQFHPPQAPSKFPAYWAFTVLYVHLTLPVHLSPFSIKPQLKALMYPDRACHKMAN